MDILNEYSAIIAIVAVLACGVLGYYTSSLRKKIIELEEKKTRIDMKMEDKNASEIFEDHLKQIQKLNTDIKEIYSICDQLIQFSENTISKVYLKRYNPFPDTGGDLSFSLALLNDKNDGVLISSLHGREETRVYTKPIIKGKTNYNVSKEEEETIAKCIQVKN